MPTRRALSLVVIVAFLLPLAVILLALALLIVAFAACYKLASGRAPYWSNCIFWAVKDWVSAVCRDWPTRTTSHLPPGGFVAVCASCYGPFPHVMRSQDQKTWYAYMPTDEHVNRLFPPLTFVGTVEPGNYTREKQGAP